MPASKKKADKNAEGEPPAKKLNKASSDFETLNFDCKSKSANGGECNFKISTWNVDGLRAWLKKGGLDFLKYEKPDVICLQEIKCSLDKLPAEMKVQKFTHVLWLQFNLFLMFLKAQCSISLTFVS